MPLIRPNLNSSRKAGTLPPKRSQVGEPSGEPVSEQAPKKGGKK